MAQGHEGVVDRSERDYENDGKWTEDKHIGLLLYELRASIICRWVFTSACRIQYTCTCREMAVILPPSTMAAVLGVLFLLPLSQDAGGFFS
jgi:hypothetical protein